MDRIKWKVSGLFKADAEKVGAEIKGIGTEVAPDDLVSYAEGNPESELHKCFEWDDTIAAERFRIQQARNILCNIVMVPDKPDIKEEPHRVFYCIDTESGRTAYKETAVIYTNDSERADLFSRAKKELKSFREKYRMLTELKDVFDAIDEL